jgi:hypothetical protein
MAAHKGPASSRPRCTRSGSSVAAVPIYQCSLCIRLTTLPPLRANSLEIWKPQPSETLWACNRSVKGWLYLYRDIKHDVTQSSTETYKSKDPSPPPPSLLQFLISVPCISLLFSHMVYTPILKMEATYSP